MKEGSCWKGPRPPISDNCDVYEHIYDGCKCDAPDTLGPDYFCYQYHKSVSYDYKCADGTVLKNNKCYDETTVDAESYKTCESGFTLKGTECVKEVNKKAETVKKCETGFELKDNKCIKETREPATKEYECDPGFEYKNELCRKYERVEAK